MKELTKEYLLLFNTITDIEDALKDLGERLVAAQQKAEDLYLESDGEQH